ncbi:MAG TPA: DUF362 domain-containing protein [Syntrophorhabdaceae bacterium]|nr:DUF362 domain-containing protein [Syntrophorhabdaceae bacterium]
MEKIVAGEIERYEKERIKTFLEKGLNDIGLTFHNKRVLIKPNLLSGHPPEKAITTHPLVVCAIAEILKDNSCEVFIGDSPGYESTEKVLKKAGFLEIIQSLNIKISRFDKKIVKRRDGISPYKEFTFGEDPSSFDLIFNVPKLKTHVMMGLTLGVKNTFGFIHAFDKARWHLKAGKDRELFAKVLIDIHNIVAPHITVLDGIIGMDGDGPSNGRVRTFGILCISKNAFALDHFIEKMINVPFLLPVTKVAERFSLVNEYETVIYGYPKIEDFILPNTINTDWNLPSSIKTLLRNLFIKKPKLKKDKCKKCGICKNVCPASAIYLSEEHIEFDYKKCIRCYCCQEMCPNNAIKI